MPSHHHEQEPYRSQVLPVGIELKPMRREVMSKEFTLAMYSSSKWRGSGTSKINMLTKKH